ncbi:metallophosphoesterase, partial [Rhizobium leguminosarum]
MITRRGFFKVLGGGIAGVMSLGGYAFAYEPLARLAITRYQLTPPGWTPGLK